MKSMFSSASTAIERTKRAAENARQKSLSNLSTATKTTKGLAGSALGLVSEEEKIRRTLEKNEPVRVSGLVWKRRGGVSGKLASYSSAWELRPMELRGTALLYYNEATKEEGGGGDVTAAGTSSILPLDHEEEEEDPCKKAQQVRGYLNLAEEKAAVQAAFGHSGAPSPFCISIKVGLAQETKWKLCFDRHQTQMEWLAALSDVVIQCSVDDYNHALLEVANPHSPQRMLREFRPPPVYEPSAGDDDDGQPNTTLQVHRLWMRDEYAIQSAPAGDDADAAASSTAQTSSHSPSVDNALQVMEMLLSEKEKVRVSMDQKIRSLEDDVGRLRQTIQEKDTTLDQLASSSSAEKTKDEEALALSLHEKENELGRLRQAIEERDTALATISAEKKSVEEQLDPLRQTVSENDSRITQIAVEKDTLRVSMEAQIHALQDELSKSVETHHASLTAVEEEFREKLRTVQQQQENEIIRIREESKISATKENTTNAEDDTPPSVEHTNEKLVAAAAAVTSELDGGDDDDDEFEDCVDNLN